MKKIAIFDQHVALTRKRHMIGPSLVWNATGTCTRSVERCHIQWLWTTSNLDFKNTALFDTEYIRNDTRQSYNGML